MGAEENLDFYVGGWRLPAEDRRARIRELLQQMGPWGCRSERVGSWSRGMRQRLALARTLLHRQDRNRRRG